MILFMAVVKHPLHSQEARGSVGRSIIFRKRGTKIAAYSFYYPGSKSKTEASVSQSNQRDLYRVGAYGWPSLPKTERAYYTRQSLYRPVTGYNLFMADFLSAVPCASLGLLRLAQARLGLT